ncbi:hypothetical protein GUJ93_ZPchr0005g15099 [Zizania palustris]|uniref:Uncharacterized protein n=1 Tax=Zizania palustris TaxID=103762 RepID=A0A8J5SF39_ZIZPA|nr:hypothetical protein GUJ93_ZPchr0005g15099 [Zizania palustris]
MGKTHIPTLLISSFPSSSSSASPSPSPSLISIYNTIRTPSSTFSTPLIADHLGFDPRRSSPVFFLIRRAGARSFRDVQYRDSAAAVGVGGAGEGSQPE